MMPNIYDQFDVQEAPPPQAPGGPLRLTVTPSGQTARADLSAGGNVYDQFDTPQNQPGYLADVAQSIPAGLVRGGAMLLGAPADATNLAFDWLGRAEKGFRGETDEQYAARTAERKAAAGFDAQKLLEPLTSKSIRGAIERNVTGPLYEPQTTPGKFANTAAEFVPGALLGPGGVARNALSYGVIPGMASEAAGQVTQGTAAEPWARGGAALIAGGGAAYWNRPNNVGRTIQEATEGITAQHLDAAEQLFQQAQSMGSPITRAEALQHVTGGATRLGDVQRVVEGSGKMRPFFAGRPAQNDAVARRAFDALEPAPTNAPSTIGPATGRAADESINEVRQRINAVSDPFYARSATVQLTPQEMGQVRALPGYREAAAAVRADPQLNRNVAHLPENSVGFLNEVKKQLDQAAENATAPLAQQRSVQRAAGLSSDAAAVRQAGINASPDYAAALAIQEHGRSRFLEPLLQGPLGKLADKDLPTRKAIEVLFPRNPLPNSADEISTALSAVNQRNPWAARQLLRAHAESTFNQATRDLQSGPTQWGGAGFASAIRGNPQQAENLAAAIQAVHGDAAWQGFDRFLQVMEAQGTRQRIGSQTAFNTEMLGDLRRGKAVGEAVLQASTVGLNLPRKVKDTIERWRLGRNVDELANLFTNPEAGPRFGQLAQAPAGSSQAAALTSRLVYMALQPSRSPSTPANRQ
jgi:hypothetical protein